METPINRVAEHQRQTLDFMLDSLGLHHAHDEVVRRDRIAELEATVAALGAENRGLRAEVQDLEQQLYPLESDTPEDLDLPMRRRGDVVESAAGGERRGMPAAKAGLSWLQHEALRIVSERREVRRRDVIARCRISREVARRELAGLVRLGLLRRVGFGRGARYLSDANWRPVGELPTTEVGPCVGGFEGRSGNSWA